MFFKMRHCDRTKNIMNEYYKKTPLSTLNAAAIEK